MERPLCYSVLSRGYTSTVFHFLSVNYNDIHNKMWPLKVSLDNRGLDKQGLNK